MRTLSSAARRPSPRPTTWLRPGSRRRTDSRRPGRDRCKTAPLGRLPAPSTTPPGRRGRWPLPSPEGGGGVRTPCPTTCSHEVGLGVAVLRAGRSGGFGPDLVGVGVGHGDAPRRGPPDGEQSRHPPGRPHTTKAAPDRRQGRCPAARVTEVPTAAPQQSRSPHGHRTPRRSVQRSPPNRARDKTSTEVAPHGRPAARNREKPPTYGLSPQVGHT